MKATPLITTPPSAHGEGPVWDAAAHRLFWVDLTGCKLHVLNPVDERFESRCFDESVCAVAPQEDGSLLISFAKRIARVDWTSGVILETLCNIEPNIPGNRANDGKADPAGRFWIGTMSEKGDVPEAGALYRLDGSQLTCILGDLTIANGMGWSSDSRTMFFIDSPTREVWAFDFDVADSSISNRRVVVRVPENLGIPDGMCVAPDDALWVAHWGSGCVCHWDPRDGKLLGRIDTGCPHTTSRCFGPDKSLYITTSRFGLDEATLAGAPDSGRLFLSSCAF